jgi:hypothetical protein
VFKFSRVEAPKVCKLNFATTKKKKTNKFVKIKIIFLTRKQKQKKQKRVSASVSKENEWIAPVATQQQRHSGKGKKV